MGQVNQKLVELVISRLANNPDLLKRFLNAPVAVIAELSSDPIDQPTLDAIGDRLRERLSSEKELTNAELESAIGGAFFSWRPRIGSIGGFTGTITAT